MIRHTPKIMAKPTEKATTVLSIVASIRPSLMDAALSAITMSAGSAMVVPKPIIKPKMSIQKVDPLCAKSLANPSPTGNIPTSSPSKKTARPTPTMASPMAVLSQFSGTL